MNTAPATPLGTFGGGSTGLPMTNVYAGGFTTPSSYASPTTAPTVPSTIPLAATQTTPLQIPPTNPAPNSALDSAIATQAGQTTAANTADTTSENTYNASNDVLNNLNMQLGNQTADTQKAENQVGLPQLNTQLTDLKTLQGQQLGNYINAINKIQSGQGGGTVAGQEGQNAYVTRQHGIDALLTSSLIQAKEGNITSAQATVDRAIAAKYDPINNAIKVQNDIIKQNYDQLTRADKKLADAKLEENNLKEKQIDQTIQNEKDINAIKLEAAKNGAPNSILALMGNSKTVGEALQNAGGFIEDKLAKDIQRAQLAQINAATAKTLSEVKNTPAGASELKTSALQTAQQIRDAITNGTAQGAIGAKGFSSLFGLKSEPFAGSEAAGFVNLYNNFKALLSLDNVKLLKGQGQVSDAERKLLEDASSKLNRNTSEKDFTDTLNQVIIALGGSTLPGDSLSRGGTSQSTSKGQTTIINGVTYVSNGTAWIKQ